MNAIEKRQAREKELLIEQLKKTPIIQIACEKLGVGRASYYRWRKEDSEFAKTADEAIQEGSMFINDMAESRLISSIKDNSLGAIFFWLRAHHPSYTTKIEVDAKLKMDKETLTAEQEALVKKALKLAGLLTAGQEEKGEENGR